jgi:hypothetical protein
MRVSATCAAVRTRFVATALAARRFVDRHGLRPPARLGSQNLGSRLSEREDSCLS